MVLMSHSNGFNLPPNFKLIQGRDYPIVKQLQSVVEKRGKTDMRNVLCLDHPYTPWETKAIIKQFDMFVTGRLHASVAALSQNVPTVFIMHGHGPKSHKIIGFAKIVGIEDYVAYPNSPEDIKNKIQKCWDNMDSLKKHLTRRIPLVKETVRSGFDAIRDAIDG